MSDFAEAKAAVEILRQVWPLPNGWNCSHPAEAINHDFKLNMWWCSGCQLTVLGIEVFNWTSGWWEHGDDAYLAKYPVTIRDYDVVS